MRMQKDWKTILHYMTQAPVDTRRLVKFRISDSTLLCGIGNSGLPYRGMGGPLPLSKKDHFSHPVKYLYQSKTLRKAGQKSIKLPQPPLFGKFGPILHPPPEKNQQKALQLSVLCTLTMWKVD